MTSTDCTDLEQHALALAVGAYHECYDGQAENLLMRGYRLVEPYTGQKVKDQADVLDHGEVVLVDAMADDLKVVGSARVSTRHDPSEASKGEESDRKLVSFLMTNGHGSPFEHSVFQFFIRLPLFVRSEWQRHRIGSFNEQSGRYAAFKPVFYVPDRVRVAHPENKQSSVETEDDTLNLGARVVIDHASMSAFATYEKLLERGVAREHARLVLPLNLYTTMWWTVNARSLMNFLMLRNSDAAQWEIRQYAIQVEAMFARAMPYTYDAWRAVDRRAP